jgi:YD repeat-containing protein
LLAYLRGERVGLVHDLGHEQPEGGGDVGRAHGARLHEEHVVLRSELARLLRVHHLGALGVVLVAYEELGHLVRVRGRVRGRARDRVRVRVSYAYEALGHLVRGRDRDRVRVRVSYAYEALGHLVRGRDRDRVRVRVSYAYEALGLTSSPE